MTNQMAKKNSDVKVVVTETVENVEKVEEKVVVKTAMDVWNELVAREDIRVCNLWKDDPQAFSDWYDANAVEGKTLVSRSELYSPAECSFE